MPWSSRPPYAPPPVSRDVFGDLRPATFVERLHNLRQHEWIDAPLARMLDERYQELSVAVGVLDSNEAFSVAELPGAVPIHGDAAPHNFLSLGKSVTALLDFELAGYGPADIDIFRLAHWVDAMSMNEKEGSLILSDFLLQFDDLSRRRMYMYYLVRWVGLAEGWLQERVQHGSTYQPQIISEPFVEKLWQELRSLGPFARSVE